MHKFRVSLVDADGVVRFLGWMWANTLSEAQDKAEAKWWGVGRLVVVLEKGGAV